MRPVWNASETRCDSPPADTGGSILAGSVARNRSAGRYGIHHTKSLPDLSGIVLLARNLHLAGATGLRTAMRRWTEAGRWRCTGYRSFSSRRPIDLGLQVDAFGGDIARVVMFSASWASALIATFSRLRRFRSPRSSPGRARSRSGRAVLGAVVEAGSSPPKFSGAVIITSRA